MITEVGTDGATTLSCINFSGYVGHVIVFSKMFTNSIGLVLELDLVSGWLVVMHTYMLSLSHCLLARIAGLWPRRARRPPWTPRIWWPALIQRCISQIYKSNICS